MIEPILPRTAARRPWLRPSSSTRLMMPDEIVERRLLPFFFPEQQ